MLTLEGAKKWDRTRQVKDAASETGTRSAATDASLALTRATVGVATFLVLLGAHAALLIFAPTASAAGNGPQGFRNAATADVGSRYVGQSRPTGWDKPGECIKWVQSWVREAGGRMNGGGPVTAFRSSPAVEVAGAEATRGDVFQISQGDTYSGSPHTGVVLGPRNPDGTFDVVEGNIPLGSGRVRTHRRALSAPANHQLRFWRFGTVPPPGPAPGSPTGSLDHASGAAGGLIQVNGWTLDPDNRAAVGEVHVYVDGPAGQGGRYIGNLRAGNVRRDVAAAHGANPARGFSGALGGVPAGNHRIYVYALNAAGGGDDVVIGSPTVNVPNLPAGSSFGSFDEANGRVGGKASVRGWAVDPDVPAHPLEIHAYVDGPFGAASKGVNLGRPSVARPDIPGAVPGAGPNQGYSGEIDGLEPGQHTIWIYAINHAGGGDSRMIGTRTVDVPGPSPLANVEHMSSAAGGFVQLNGWALDPDLPERPTAVHVYIDGNRAVGALDAANTRPDIPNAFPGASREHGFSGALGGIPPGRHRVDVYAIDLNGSENVRIRSEELDFAALPAGSPTGSFDDAITEPGGVRLRGWAFDPDSPRDALEMHAYVDGPPNAALKGINLGRAEVTRDDVGAVHPDAGAQHGLDQLVEGLPDGRHTIWLYAINAQTGDHSPLLGTRTVVTGAETPGTTIDSGPSSTIGEPSATFAFSSGRAGSTFECKLDDQDYESCTSPKSYASLSVGSHEFSVRAIDPEGDTDPSPATQRFAVDTAPETSIDAGPSGSTDDPNPTFRFSSDEEGAGFECRLDDGEFERCESPKSYGGLADGAHTFSVRAVDAAGNEDRTPATRTFTVKEPGPDTTIFSGPSGSINDSSPSFRFSADKPGSTFRCRLDSGRSGPCTSPKSYSGLGDGAHTFRVRAIDASGNEDPTVATRSFTVDTVIPVVKNLVLDPTPFDISRDRTLDIDFGVDEPGGGFRVNAKIQDLTSGRILRSLGTQTKSRSGALSFSWDGRDDDGRRAARGRYAAYLTVSDTAGNRTAKRKSFALTR